MNNLIIILTSLFILNPIQAQEFIPLWPMDNLPNSKGVKVVEVIENERIIQVDTPGFYTFFTSQEENQGSAVIIFPSGGYHRLTYNMGGFQLAKWFNTLGINAFVLKYRLPHSPDLKVRHEAPLQDAQRAMRIIRARAEQWSIDPKKIGVMGTSAGGHLASTMGTHEEDVSAIGDTLDGVPFNPNFMVLVSPVITMGAHTHEGSLYNLLGKKPSEELKNKYSNELHVTPTTPPCFLAHAANDKAVDPRNSIFFFHALLDKNVPACLHIFPKGGHNINLHDNPGSTELWTDLCEEWLIEIGMVKRGR